MSEGLDSILRERFEGQTDPPPGPDFDDVRARARCEFAAIGRRPRRRILVAALVATAAIGGGASALAYHYLGPSPGFTSGFSAFDRLPPEAPPPGKQGLVFMASHLGLSDAEAAERWRLVQTGVTLGDGRSENRGKIYALLGNDGSACLLLLGQGGTCINKAATEHTSPGILPQILPGYPGQTPALVALVADNVDSVAISISDRTQSLPIINNSIYTDLTDMKPCDTLALNVTYDDSSTRSLDLTRHAAASCPNRPRPPAPTLERGPAPVWPAEINGRSVLGEQLVLQLNDLPADFDLQSERANDALDASLYAPRATASQHLQWGRTTGFTVVLSKKEPGLGYFASVLSSVSVYRDTSGAEEAINGSRDCNQSGLYPTSLDPLPGEQGFACELRSPHTYLLAWRQGPIVASLKITMYRPGQLNEEDAIALAQTQADHITKATGG
jgi:hypothetical protein